MKSKMSVLAFALAVFCFAAPVWADDCQCADPLNVNVFCFNEISNIGEGTATASGGVGPYSYSWSISGGTLLTGGNTTYVAFQGLGYVTATVTVTDSCGNTKSRSCTLLLQLGGGGPIFKDSAASLSEEMTVRQVLEVLESSKEPGYRVAFDGNYLFDPEALMNAPVLNMIDDGKVVTLILHEDEVIANEEREIGRR